MRQRNQIEGAAFVANPTRSAEERAPGGRREWFFEDWFLHAGRLTDEHDFAENRPAGNRWWNHSRAAPALPQERYVPIERLLLARRARHWIEDNEERRLRSAF